MLLACDAKQNHVFSTSNGESSDSHICTHTVSVEVLKMCVKVKSWSQVYTCT